MFYNYISEVKKLCVSEINQVKLMLCKETN